MTGGILSHNCELNDGINVIICKQMDVQQGVALNRNSIGQQVEAIILYL